MRKSAWGKRSYDTWNMMPIKQKINNLINELDRLDNEYNANKELNKRSK